MLDQKDEIKTLEESASEVSFALKALSNERRLIILCQLVRGGEMSVGALLKNVDLGQSALSQHLARMREEGLVATRRQGQSIHYRIADKRIEDLMVCLHRIYCSE